MEQLTKILTSNFTSNALITAFVVVGIVVLGRGLDLDPRLSR